jgi:two-component system CheB/CheR fusion protein
LHDGLCQELHGISYLARLLERELEAELPGRAAEAGRLSKALDHALNLTRDVAHGLRPVYAIPEGLMVTLRELAQRTRGLYGVDCRFECREPVLIRRHSVASHLYRIAQEAVSNSIKHARPTRIRIRLAATSRATVLRVRDNGVGIRSKKGGFQGMGLHIMKYRADAIQGSIAVERRPRGGTEVVCTVPRGSLIPSEENQNEGKESRG